MSPLDTASLSTLITQCFFLSGDGRLSAEKRSAFLVAGKRLRGLLVNLISAQFDDTTQEVLDANQQMQAASDKVKQLSVSLKKLDDTLNTVNTVVQTLDGLLSLAAKFV